ncbi:MAG: hypothetical protein G3M78_07865 [Candidatus Nitrohelix vancouverensis]|uniref:Uncharacterized protein n=1 Tax=Candidatus Nitrohelix vancouverensis TaxID=2705534 RepID=A0A7T0C2F1_9BACT|nr:MAG: hypothetical protein G3M78_07865 [Candidatus Nitrohelix vancouverensis]
MTSILPRLKFWSQNLLIITTMAWFLAHLHIFFNYIDRAPFLSFDDVLMNISFTIADLKRYGFTALPVQTGINAWRGDSFFNYGPWYWVIGGAVSWLFGNSIVLMRALHPLGLIFICFMAYWQFRKVSVALAGIVSLLIFLIFFQMHWPMVRPDIMASVFAAIAIVCCHGAIKNGKLLNWFIAGFCASGAATNHQVAWSMVPALVLIWAVWAIDYKRADKVRTLEDNLAVKSFFSALAGGLSSALVYLVMIEFRFQDLLGMWQNYASTHTTKNPAPFIDVLLQHMHFAWQEPGTGRKMILSIGVYSIAIISLLLLPKMSGEARNKWIAWVLPPTFIGVGYQLSLGVYPNFHAGYEILTQWIPVWTGCSLLAASSEIWLPKETDFKRGMETGLCFLLTLIIANQSISVLKQGSPWQSHANQSVQIQDYIDHVISILPKGASAFGTPIFGLESGTRVNLMQFADGVYMGRTFKPSARDALAPNFLILSYEENRSAAISGLKREKNFFYYFKEVFPNANYALVRLVEAPPYGSTRVYMKTSEHNTAPKTPSVALHTGSSPQWSYNLGNALPIKFTKDGPVDFDVTMYGVQYKTESNKVLKGNLPQGSYLIAFDIINPAQDYSSILTFTGSNKIVGSGSDLGVGFPVMQYFPFEKQTYMLLNHPGGDLFISQLDSNLDSSFQIRNVFPVETLENGTVQLPSVPIPDIRSWSHSKNTHKISQSPDGDTLQIQGNDSQWGYQLQSPEILVSPDSNYMLRVPLKILEGNVRVGILDESEQWLVSPLPAGKDINFNVRNNRTISIVLTNHHPRKPETPSKFQISNGWLWENKNETYADRLGRCIRQLPGADLTPCNLPKNE